MGSSIYKSEGENIVFDQINKEPIWFDVTLPKSLEIPS